MQDDIYLAYLKRTGRKDSVISRYFRFVEIFETYLVNYPKITLNDAKPSHLQKFVKAYESWSNKSAKSVLYALQHYYSSISNEKMKETSMQLRAPRKSKRPTFPLKEILGIDPKYIKILADNGIKNVEQMREGGQNKALRIKLAEKTMIPPEIILELVQIADLVRVGYIKKKLTRLFHNAGIKTPADLKKWNPDELYEYLSKYISQSGWEGMTPYKSDLANYINSAKKLPQIIEYE